MSECEALRPCEPVHGGWTIWSKWSGCSASCGKGGILRTRTCTNPTPQYDGKKCFGESVQNRPCYLKKCATDYDPNEEMIAKIPLLNKTMVSKNFPFKGNLKFSKIVNCEF